MLKAVEDFREALSANKGMTSPIIPRKKMRRHTKGVMIIGNSETDFANAYATMRVRSVG